MIGEADDEISRAFRAGASPVAAGSRVTAPATQNKHICRNVADCVFMAGRHNRDLLMQRKSVTMQHSPRHQRGLSEQYFHADSQDKMKVRAWGWS